jgi:hypothetical protein
MAAKVCVSVSAQASAVMSAPILAPSSGQSLNGLPPTRIFGFGEMLAF